MLVRFSVSNFKSIGEEQSLLLTAGASSADDENFAVQTNNIGAPAVLKACAILGPNASGKSSALEALEFYQDFVRRSAAHMTEGDPIPVTPNKLSGVANSTSSFEAHFLVEGILVQYGFELNSKRVVSEWMYQRAAGARKKNVLWFERQWDENRNDYDWDFNESQLKGEREVWRKSTRENALFFSNMLVLNATNMFLIFSWFMNSAGSLLIHQRPSNFFSSHWLKTDEDAKNFILKFLNSADISIEDIFVTDKEKEKDGIENNDRNALPRYKVEFAHLRKDGTIGLLAEQEESDGTQNLYALAGRIWMTFLTGATLIIDELNKSLHPKLVRHIVSHFNDAETNPNGAQLIFSSHDPSFIEPEVIHKDQIYLTSKVDNQTQLTPLSDYKVRDTSSFGRAYLAGKFDALPNVGPI